jgi:Na+/H+ antiporter NhaC
MHPLVVAFIVLACAFGGAMFGLFLGRVLPKHHLTAESKEAVKLVTGMIATLAALVLGLLVSSAKGSFDSVGEELRQTASQVILLDRVLGQYGAEAKELRIVVRRQYAAMVEQIFSADQGERLKATAPQRVDPIEDIENRIGQLVPTNDAQRELRSRALQIGGDLAKMHWSLIEHAGSSIPLPFLAVLVSWLTAIFAAFGLFSPRNATVITALFIGSLSVSTAIYLIVALDRPLVGVTSMSSDPMRNALQHLGQ